MNAIRLLYAVYRIFLSFSSAAFSIRDTYRCRYCKFDAVKQTPPDRGSGIL